MPAGGRSGIKTASEAEERELIRRVQELAEDPMHLLPECIHDDADGCRLRKVEKKLRKVHEKQGDKKKLKRASGGFFGHDLAKALADSLMLAEEGEAPYLGRVRFPGREAVYAKRGKADKQVLAAVQHHDDPRLRVLPLRKDIEKGDLHIYSCTSGWWCTGTRPDPPDEYVRSVLGGLDAVQARGDGVHACPHVPPDAVGGSGPAHLVVTWRSADRRVAVCEDCVGGGNAALQLMAGIASPDPTAEFDVEVHLPVPECRGHEGTCPAAEAHRAAFDLSGYLEGDLSDRKIFERCRDQVQDRLRGGSALLLARDVCFGDDREGFLAWLEGTEMERTALDRALGDHTGPVITGQATANKLLAELWDEHARTFLEAVGDPEIAEDLLDRKDPRNTPPVEILSEAKRRYQQAHLQERLPSYGDLPKPIEVADRIARHHRLQGQADAVRAAEPDRSWDTRAKGVGYGFLLAFGEASGKEWKFTEEERESGEFLTGRIEALLDADAEDYHDALVDVARAAGVTTTFEPEG